MVLVIHFALQKFAPTFSIVLNVLIYLGAVRTRRGNIWGNTRHPVPAYPPWVCLSARPCFPPDSALQEHLARAAAHLAFSCLTLGSGETYSEMHFLWRKLAGDALSLCERGEHAEERSWLQLPPRPQPQGALELGWYFRNVPSEARRKGLAPTWTLLKGGYSQEHGHGSSLQLRVAFSDKTGYEPNAGNTLSTWKKGPWAEGRTQ